MAVIYGLVHVASGRTYVGCTAGKIQKRFREHRCLLNHGRHKEPVLQKEWTVYGPEAFRIEVLESLVEKAPKSVRREAELRWMKKLEDEGFYTTSTRFLSASPRKRH